MDPIWRIVLDFEVKPDESFSSLFEFIERVVEEIIDPHESGEECVRFWSMEAAEATEEYEEEMGFFGDPDDFGLLNFLPEDLCMN